MDWVKFFKEPNIYRRFTVPTGLRAFIKELFATYYFLISLSWGIFQIGVIHLPLKH